MQFSSPSEPPSQEGIGSEQDCGGGGDRDMCVLRLIHQKVSWFLFFCCSVAQLYPTLCIPMDCSTPGCPSPCPSPSPRACSNSYPLNQLCHLTILSCVIPFSSCPQSFPASGSFTLSQFFASGGQSMGDSASASVLPMNIQD